MLLANKTVAAEIGRPVGKKKPKAFVYRIHDQPDATKLADIKGRAEENLLAVLAVRSMAKAVYSTENIGHYGLGFDYYTHFTSPIRRYPDMMVHRLLAKYLDGGRSVNVDKLEAQCKHSSDMEQLAASAERSSIKYKQVEYMQDHLGDVFDGVISGVTEWGLYVEIEENLCEGLVPVRDLADDYYDFDERNYSLVGRRNNVRYRLGDKVKVQVARTAIDKRQLDFVLFDNRQTKAPASVAQALHDTPSKRGNTQKKSGKRKSSARKK